MTNETQQTTPSEQKPVPFGSRLKSAREASGLERKEAAAQLRLNEKIIVMMEKDRYPSDLPATFIRGYIRAYGKLLQIPEFEIKKAIEPIKSKVNPNAGIAISKTVLAEPVTSSNYLMQFFTYLIIFTLIGLVGTWWYTHNTPRLSIENPLPTANSPAIIPDNLNQATSPLMAPQATVFENSISTSTGTLQGSTSNANPSQPASLGSESEDQSSQEIDTEQKASRSAPAKASHQQAEQAAQEEETKPDQASSETNTNAETNSEDAE